MNLKKFMNLFSVAFFGIYGFYAIFSGIGVMVAYSQNDEFNVFGLFTMFIGMLLCVFALLCFLYQLKKDNPFLLMIGSGTVAALIVLIDFIGRFTGGSSGIDRLVLVALAAMFIYDLLLYQQMVSEGKIVRQNVGSQQSSPVDALQNLAGLKASGLITDEEYESKRKEYINKL